MEENTALADSVTAGEVVAMTMPAVSLVVVPDELSMLKSVYLVREEYKDFDAAKEHLANAASTAAMSSDRDLIESERVSAFMWHNPSQQSFWHISWQWYQELVDAVADKFPDQASSVRYQADLVRSQALLAVKW